MRRMMIGPFAVLALFVFMQIKTIPPHLAHYDHDGPALLADPSITPGEINPMVVQANIHQTICVSGWTRTVRPPVSYTEPLKLKQMKQYGDVIPDPTGKCMLHSANPRCYEEDHKIPLEVGGAPRDPANLSPEPYKPVPGAHQKDRVENYLHRQVCGGKMALAKAQNEIRGDWYKIYLQMKSHGSTQ